MVGFKTVKDIDVRGKRILLRTDYNVPIDDHGIRQDYRISQSVPTIRYLLEQGADSVVIISHRGRPHGSRHRSCSLKPIADCLSTLLKKNVGFARDCIGEEAVEASSKLKPGEVLVLENLRFHIGEETNDEKFAKQLVKATDADIFVQDGFGAVHRSAASTEVITKLLPSVGGLLLEKEVSTLSAALSGSDRPLMVVVGGAKTSTKFESLKKFIECADCVAVTGALANNFLLAEGYKVGKSVTEEEYLGAAKEILQLAKQQSLKRPFSLIIPQDVVVSKTIDGLSSTRVVDFSFSLADIEAYPKLPEEPSHTVMPDESISDIGPISAGRIAGAIQMSRTVIWNGPSGKIEVRGISGAAAPFSHGTRKTVDAIIGTSRCHQNKPFSVAGGGDTVSYIEQNSLIDDFNFVSTGGGAMLALLSGRKLPGLEALSADHSSL